MTSPRASQRLFNSSPRSRILLWTDQSRKRDDLKGLDDPLHSPVMMPVGTGRALVSPLCLQCPGHFKNFPPAMPHPWPGHTGGTPTLGCSPPASFQHSHTMSPPSVGPTPMMGSLPTPCCTWVQPWTEKDGSSGSHGKQRWGGQGKGAPGACGQAWPGEALSPQCFTDPMSRAWLPGDQSQLMVSILGHKCF